MADVQKAKGAIQISNHLFEAMIAAEFSAPQLRIVMALLRLTYGWNALGVRMKEAELAKRSGGAGLDASRAGGAWRVAMDRLIQNNVVLTFPTDRRGVFLWGVNKDYETWKQYASSESKLGAVWGVKSDNRREDGRLIKQRIDAIGVEEGKRAGTNEDAGENHSESHSEDASESDSEGRRESAEEPESEQEGASIEWTESGPDTWPDSSPEEPKAPEINWPAHRRGSGLYTGQITEAKSFIGETYEGPKDRKDISTVVSTDLCTNTSNNVVAETALAVGDEKTEPQAPPKAPPKAAPETSPDETELTRQYAIHLSTAVNAGIGQRWFGGNENPNPVTYASGIGLAEELRRANVPLELARATIVSVCKASKKLEPPGSVSWFRRPILEAFRAAEQKLLNQNDPLVKRGGAPTPIAAAVDPHKATRDRLSREQLELEHGRLKSAAAAAWAERPENRATAAAITVRAREEFAEFGTSSWVERSIQGRVVTVCAERAGFPDFETWLAQRPPPDAPPGKPPEE